ncbi:MAG: penicillin-binding protein 2 [Thermoleophilia bacterium]|nr:penicillin-binding protein 2 [Thermoleophilia bacterium]
MSPTTKPGPSQLATVTVSPRRLMLLLVGLLLLVFAVGARTVYLQSIKNRTLSQYAQGQQRYTQPLPAVRGDILDRNGQELAVGEEAVTFYATPKLLKRRAETAVDIAEILDMSRQDEELLVDRLVNATGGFVYVARQVPREKAEKLQEAKIPGVSWNDEERRMYPAGAVAGQIIGRVDIDNKGVDGVEMLYDRSLTGRPGEQVAVVDPTGVPIDVLKLRRERDGRDVHLTIDATIQQQAELVLTRTVKKFGARAASAIVMDPRTGEVLAMANVPRVNPAKWNRASGLQRRNTAITDMYEPGSTFKVVAVSAALEEGVVTPDTKKFLKPQMTFCDDKDTCTVKESHPRPAGWFSTRDILVESSNIGTITLAQDVAQKYINQGKCGKCEVDRWIRRFGFGSTTGIDFPGEAPGIMLPTKDWSDVSIGNIPIGQGISVTPIQLAAAYAAIANDGVIVQPHLLQRIGSEPRAKYSSRRVLSAKTAATMRSMFEGVVQDDRGTGKKAGIEGYEVAGKTGTANVAGPDGYSETKYNASFVGFVPAKNPRLVTLVVVNEPTNGIFGGDVAAPAFEEITEFALGYLAIAPDGVM